MKIKGLIVLVTGGASGIGEAIATYLSENEAVVYICDLDISKGAEIETSSKGKIVFIKCDVTIEEDIKSVFDKIKSEQGKLDVLINSAGILGGDIIATNKKVFNTNLFEKIMSINANGTFYCSRHAAKLMIYNYDKNKECNGLIINISSIAATDGQRGQTAYSASKGAVDGMTLPMSRDLGKYNIRVNSISPGPTDTPMGKLLIMKIIQTYIDATPIKRLGYTSDITDTVVFLIKNNFMNGEIIRVDGGIRVPHF